MKKIWIFLISILVLYPVIAQQNSYRIMLSVEGYRDTLAYLGHYFGDKLSISDTMQAREGEISLAGKEPLKQGVYFIVSQDKQKLFEFIIGEDQEFEIQTSANAPAQDARVIGSADNELFFSYLRFNREGYERIKSLQSGLQKLDANNDSVRIIREEINEINTQNIDYKLNIINNNPESFVALLFNAMREPEVPDFFLPDGRHDSLATYLYYRNHYWDHIDLGDDRFLRTPVFHRKLELYFSEVIPAHPDSIVGEIDKIIAKTNNNDEMHDYLLWYFTNRYETSNVMGYDKIFVHMVDHYFTGRSYDWLHPTVQENMIAHVDKLRKLLIGEYAPLLLMADTANNFINLHTIDAEYLVIIFWSSTCGECRNELKALNDLYLETDFDLKVYAINTDTSFIKWKEYIKKHELDWVHVNGNLSLTGDYHEIYDIYSTPVIYLLDEQKVIIAKRIAAKNIAAFMGRNKKGKTN
jgi:thiol-disulfide isomerase/thioredoxin